MPGLVSIRPMPYPAGASKTAGTRAALAVEPCRSLRSDIRPRLLYRDENEAGFSMDLYDFELKRGETWSQELHSNNLMLGLNINGSGILSSSDRDIEMPPSTSILYRSGQDGLRTTRHLPERHCFVTVEFAPAFLRRNLPGCSCTLDVMAGQYKLSTPCLAQTECGEIQPMSAAQKLLVSQLVNPLPVEGARQLLYQGLALQMMAHFFFSRCEGEDLNCPAQKPVAQERVQRVMAILRRDLSNPPSLDEIGREIGCSPYHLSRTFSKELNMTIPQYLRKLRMESAAKLLTSGKWNVTEVATEVGYSSLSHFSQAFCQIMGCCPAMYAQQHGSFDETMQSDSLHLKEICKDSDNQSKCCCAKD